MKVFGPAFYLKEELKKKEKEKEQKSAIWDNNGEMVMINNNPIF